MILKHDVADSPSFQQHRGTRKHPRFVPFHVKFQHSDVPVTDFAIECGRGYLMPHRGPLASVEARSTLIGAEHLSFDQHTLSGVVGYREPPQFNT